MASKRLKTPSSCFHIFNKGIDENIIFHDADDRFKFHNILIDLIQKYNLNFIIHAYCLMDNHFHLLIETFEEDISRIIYFLDSMYAKFYNKKYERKGYFFQNRFGSRMIFSKYHFKIVQSYIHNNWNEANRKDLMNNKLYCSYTCFMDKKNLFSHFDYSKSIILYRADSPENEIKNFYNFTNETSYKSYSIKYKFSDILFMIQILANKYDEEDRWIITAFLLRTFTRAKFYEIFEIIELENTDASRKRTHRAIKKLSTTFKSELKKELSRMVEPKKCLLSAAGREQTLSVV